MHHKKGLTIIECLLSITILAIMLIAGMAFYFNAQAGFRWSVHKRIALELANSELESIKSSGYSSLPKYPDTHIDEVYLWTDSNHTKRVQVGNLPLPVQPNQKVYVIDRDANGDHTVDYKEVQVVITWQQPGKPAPESISLDTYII